jgi:hypothetical protein
VKFDDGDMSGTGRVMRRLHVGGNVPDCGISKLVRNFILIICFRKMGDV